MSVKYKDENGNLVDLAGMPQQTSFTTDDGTVLNTIDEKLNYLIENGSSNNNFDNSNITFSELDKSQQIDVEKNDVIVIIASCAFHGSNQDYGTLSGTCKYSLLSQMGKVITSDGRYTQHCITVIKINEAGTLIGTPFGSVTSMITFVKIN